MLATSASASQYVFIRLALESDLKSSTTVGMALVCIINGSCELSTHCEKKLYINNNSYTYVEREERS